MKFNLDDVYWLFRDSVRYFAANDERCRQIQSFRVLQEDYAAELSTANFGASLCDKGKPYFYSREWEKSGYRDDRLQADFPVLTVMEVFESGVRKEPFTTGSFSVKIELAVVDRFIPDKQNCKGCDGRLVDELYRDTQELLNQVLKFAGTCSIYQVGDRQMIANSDLMKAWLNAGQISDYTEVHPFGSLLQSGNLKVPLKRVYMPTDHYYGSMVVLDVNLMDCETPGYSFDVNLYKHDRTGRNIAGCC